MCTVGVHPRTGLGKTGLNHAFCRGTTFLADEFTDVSQSFQALHSLTYKNLPHRLPL